VGVGGRTKSIMGIRNLNLRKIHVRMTGKISLIQSLIHIHPFPSTLTPIFLFSPLQPVTKKKLSSGRKISGGEELLPSLTLPPIHVYDLKCLQIGK